MTRAMMTTGILLVLGASAALAQDAQIEFREALGGGDCGYFICGEEIGGGDGFTFGSQAGLGFGPVDLGDTVAAAYDTLGFSTSGGGDATHQSDVSPAGGTGLLLTANLLGQGSGSGNTYMAGWGSGEAQETITFRIHQPMTYSLSVDLLESWTPDHGDADATFLLYDETLDTAVFAADETGVHQLTGELPAGLYTVTMFVRGEGDGGYCGAPGPEGGSGLASLDVELAVTPGSGFLVRAEGFVPPATYLPLANRDLEILRVNATDPANYLIPLGTVTTDAAGVAQIDEPGLAEGDGFLLRTVVQEQPAARPGRAELDSLSWTVTLENAFIDAFSGDLLHDVVPAAGDTVWTVLAHATLNINLLVSIEWAATPAYVATLQESLGLASRYLYDVGNGQIRIDRVKIIDDGRHWSDADVRIHASNRSWPQANLGGLGGDSGSLEMPPVHAGDGPSNAYFAFNLDPPDLTSPQHFRTLAHELGHYALGLRDEYLDQHGNDVFPDSAGIQPDINFGMMDTQYLGQAGDNEIMSSELSAAANLIPVANAYAQTAHYQLQGQTDSWTHFVNVFSDTTANPAWRFRRPEDMGVPPGDIIPGPNEGAITTRDVAPEVRFFTDHAPSGRPRLPQHLQTPDSTAAEGALVWLVKPDLRILEHGLADVGGDIRLLGADAGDELTFFWTAPDGSPYVGQATVAAAKADAPVVLAPLAPGLEMLLAAVPEAGSTTGIVVADGGSLAAAPTLRSAVDGLPVETVLGPDPEGYRTSVADADLVAGESLLAASDAGGQAFQVPCHVSRWASVSPGEHLQGGRGVLLDVDRGGTRWTAAVLDLPPPTTGLAVGVRRLSPVVAVHADPGAGEPAGRVTVPVTVPDSTGIPAGTAVHHWQGGWIPLVSRLDRRKQRVTADLQGPGHYAVFAPAADGVSGVPGERAPAPPGFGLRPAAPNPFNPATTVAFEVPSRGHVRLEVYDIRGRHVAALVDGVLDAGAHSRTWRPERLSDGVYLLVLRQGSWQDVRRVTLLK